MIIPQPVTATAAACAAILCLAGTAAAVGPVPRADTATVSSGFRFAVPFECVDPTPCAGTVRVVTARAINPYSPRDPRRRELVAESDFAIASGATRSVGFRMSGPAMAQLLKAGQLSVRLRVATDGTDDVDRYALTLTLPRG